MQRCAFTPYEGRKPYIFVSYAHRDSDRVFPILEELDRRGYRVWYDDGIAPGSEWPENIAQHLDGCSLTLAFISPSSIASANCRREVTFALSKRKNFLGIILEPTEMSLGMEMQLSAQQCIMKYTYASDEAFYAKVCSCPDLVPCLGQPKVAAPTAPSAVEMPPQVAQPEPAPAAKPKTERKPLDKKLLAIIGGAAAVILVLVIILVAALGSGSDKKQDPSGSNADTSASQNGENTTERSLEYRDQTITDDIVAQINRQTQLEELLIENCTFDTGVFEQIDLPKSLLRLQIANCIGVGELSSLNALENLEYLELSSSGITNKMLPQLQLLSLKELSLAGNPDFSDLSKLSGCTALTCLDFSGTGVSSVETLRSAEQLLYVYGSYSNVTDITPLSDLSKLLGLHFAGCGIQSVETAFNCLRLEELNLAENALTDVSAFANCTILTHVDLSYNTIMDVDFLEKSAATLQALDLSGNAGLYYWDVEFLGSCTELKELYLDRLYLYELTVIQNLTKLERLSANDSRIDDFSAVAAMPNLQYLSLAGNSIEDISSLSNLSGSEFILDLSVNDYLSDLSALPTSPHYKVLNLFNGYLDLSTLPQVTGDTLLLFYDDAILSNTWLAEGSFSHYIILGCPTDKIVAVENHLGEESVTFLETYEEYCIALEELGIDSRYIIAQLS